MDVRTLNLSAEKLYQVENMMMPQQREFFLNEAHAKMQRDSEGMRKVLDALKRFGSGREGSEESAEDTAEDTADECAQECAEKPVRTSAEKTEEKPEEKTAGKTEERARLFGTIYKLNELRHETHVKSRKALDAYHKLEEQARVLDRSVDYINEHIRILGAPALNQVD